MYAWLLANKKMLGAITGALTTITLLYQAHSYIYDSGRESMRVEMQSLQNDALEQARKDYEKETEKSLSRLQRDHQDELIRVRNEREIITKIETVTKYVDKEIIVEAQCDNLANDVVIVLKQATSIIGTSTEEN